MNGPYSSFFVSKDLPVLLWGVGALLLLNDPTNRISIFTEWPKIIYTVTNIEAVGQCLYTYYSYFFILAGLILLVAMIGAIVLTMHKGVQVKRQHVFSQNTREFSKTVSRFVDL